MLQSEQLDKLKRLVLEGNYEDEDKVEVQRLEVRLKKAAEADKLKDIPAIKEFLAYMEKEIERCQTLLTTDETLTDSQRAKLFAIIQVSEKYTSLFNGSALRNVQASIERALRAALS